MVVTKPLGALTVQVKTAQGKPLDGLSVTAIAPDGKPNNVTDELGGGAYRVGPLVPGSYAVYVADGINPRLRVGGQNNWIAIRAGEATVDVQFGGYAGRITERVLDDSGAPLENVWVQAIASDADQDPTHNMQQMKIVAEGRRGLTDAEGKFELAGLAQQGTFKVQAELPLGGAAKVEHVKPGAVIDVVRGRGGAAEHLHRVPCEAAAPPHRAEAAAARGWQGRCGA